MSANLAAICPKLVDDPLITISYNAHESLLKVDITDALTVPVLSLALAKWNTPPFHLTLP